VSYPNAVEELKFAQLAFVRARDLEEANCPELGSLYQRLGIASAQKANILREIDAMTMDEMTVCKVIPFSRVRRREVR
jgi:hypothetical protein